MCVACAAAACHVTWAVGMRASDGGILKSSRAESTKTGVRRFAVAHKVSTWRRERERARSGSRSA